MSALSWEIEVAGDAARRRVRIDRSDSGVPTGVTITKAWLTVKDAVGDADVDAIIQKEITTSDVPGTGQIEDDGTGDADFVVRFDLTRADTLAIGVETPAVKKRHFDVQILASDGYPYTPEIGKVWCHRTEVTQATS